MHIAGVLCFAVTYYKISLFFRCAATWLQRYNFIINTNNNSGNSFTIQEILYMKATGIVRRIDDLGRVVIPKEIRRTMRIREGDPLEIYTDRDGEVIFKKYSPIGELASFAGEYAETLHKTCRIAVVICDRDTVIACAGVPRKEYFEHKLTPELEAIIEGRALFVSDGEEIVSVTEGGAARISCAMPIIAEGDVAGVVASVYTEGGDAAQSLNAELESKLIQTAAGFLGRQLES